MTIQEKLFGNLSLLDKDYFQKVGTELTSYSPPLSQEQIYSYGLFMRLMNNERFLKEIEEDFYEILGWLPNEFKIFEDFVQNGPTNVAEITNYYHRIHNLVENTKLFLEIKKVEFSAESTSNNALRIYYQIYENLLEHLDGTVIAQWETLIKNKESFKEIEQYFNLDLTGNQFEAKFEFDLQKPWLDLPPSYLYFDNAVSKVKMALSKQTFTSDVEYAITYLEELDEKILPVDIISIDTLKKAMEQYEGVDKSTPSLLQKRIVALNNIAKLAMNALENEITLTKVQKIALQEIHHQANAKSHYLSEIRVIPQKANQRAYRTEHVMGKPLVIDKMEWFEDFDPAHREHDKQLYNQWLNQAVLNESTPNYWIWMEGLDRKITSKFEIDERYTVPKEEKLVSFREGLCYNQKCSNTENGLIADGIYLFNIDKKNDLYILPSPRNYPGRGPWALQLQGKGVKDPKRNFNHNSVLNGESVKCAGCVFLKDGKIVQIDTNSGHYKPQITNLRDALQNALVPKNVFSDDAIVANFDGDHAVRIKDFVRESFDVKAHFPTEREILSREEIFKLKSQASKIALHPKKPDKEERKRKLLIWAKKINQTIKSEGSVEPSQNEKSNKDRKDKKKLN